MYYKVHWQLNFSSLLTYKTECYSISTYQRIKCLFQRINDVLWQLNFSCLLTKNVFTTHTLYWPPVMLNHRLLTKWVQSMIILTYMFSNHLSYVVKIEYITILNVNLFLHIFFQNEYFFSFSILQFKSII